MRRLGSSLVLLGLVVGAPIALVKVGFYAWGTLNVWAPTDFRFLLVLLTVVAWAGWAVFLLSLGVEGVRLVTAGRISIRLPGLGWSQALTGGLLAAVVVTTAGPVISAVAAQRSDAPRPVATAGRTPASAVPPASAKAPSVSAEATSEVASERPEIVHVVTPGDDLWSLAERYYGSGTRWREIVRANPATLGGDPVNNLPVGARLVIADPETTHTVRAGDTLWGLAEQRLGDGHRYPEIQALNDQITEPDHIEVGWTLTLPAANASAHVPTANASAHVSTANASAHVSTANASPTAIPDDAASGPAPVAPASAAEGATSAPALDVATDDGTGHDTLAIRALAGGVAALAASGVIGGLLARRRERAATRPLGRRFITPDDELRRFETALGLLPEPTPEAVPREHLVDRAMRLLAEHWWSEREPSGALRRMLLEEECLTLQFVAPLPSAPREFARDEYSGRLSIAWSQLATLDAPERPVAYPALVTLGRDPADRLVMVDLARLGVLAIDGDAESVRVTPVSAMIVELSCSPWTDELSVRVVTPDETFVDAAAVQEVRCLDAEGAVAELERHARERGALLDLADAHYDVVRLDPDRADAWAPMVFLFEEAPDATLLDRMFVALEANRVGIAAVVPLAEGAGEQAAPPRSSVPESRLRLSGPRPDADAAAVLEPDGLAVSPQVLQPEARQAIAALYRSARSEETLPASWWREAEPDARDLPAPEPSLSEPSLSEPSVAEPPDASACSRPGPETSATLPAMLVREAEGAAEVVTLRPLRVAHGPRLRLFGQTAIDGTLGEPPKKAQRRCVEYCAWLMEHPGATASVMSSALFVTDGTRRSNLSRLRAWLGQTPGGDQYLPEAYSGRISLHPAVTSDWVELRRLIERGVNRASPVDLHAALSFVEGPPLADAAPGEWAWADRLRAEMSETVRDIAVVLARLELVRGQPDAARWACERGRLVAPDDELLARELMRVEAAEGHLDEVRRIMRALTRSAADRGADLQPETAELSQQILGGRAAVRLPSTGSEG